MRQSEHLNSLVNLITDVCDGVKIERLLQPLQGKNFALRSTTTDNDARFDIRTNSLWESRLNKT